MKFSRTISVVLPIYNAVEMTKNCIEIAMKGIIAVPNTSLWLIDDASTDENMQSMLEEYESAYPNHIVFIKNEKNLGSTPSFNRGMKCARKQDDIVFFNTDVIVPSDWLERLIYEAYSKPEIGTVTPLSNNTTISAFPEFLQNNEISFGMSVDEVNACFKKYRLANIKAPSGIGFCMYIKRECINNIGYLDETNFTRGYGEENDFCQRIIKAGWTNVITPNIYVYHKGSASYGKEKEKLVEEATQTINKLYPNYFNDVKLFIQKNPLKISRLKRLADLIQYSGRNKIIHVCHFLGGGTYQHVQELYEFSHNKNVISMILLLVNYKQIIFRLNFSENSDELLFTLPGDYTCLKSLILSLNISGFHIHHLLNAHPMFLELLKELNIVYVVTIHDYYFLNKNPFIADIDNSSLDTHTKNLSTYPNFTQRKYFLQNACIVIFPSVSTKIIFDNFINLPNTRVAYHLEKIRDINTNPKKFIKKRKYIIGVLGAIGEHKGSHFLLELINVCVQEMLLVDFFLIGYSSNSKLLNVIQSTGSYRTEELQFLIKECRCDMIFFSCGAPETYSYTLSYAIESGLPIIAPNLGAFPERLSQRNHVLFYEHSLSATSLVPQLKNFINALENSEKCSAPKFNGKLASNNFYESSYLQIFDEKKSLKEELILPNSFIFSSNLASKKNQKIINILSAAVRAWLVQVLPARIKRVIKALFFNE